MMFLLVPPPLSGRRHRQSVVHPDRPEEEHGVQFPCGGQQQARSRCLHGGRRSSDPV